MPRIPTVATTALTFRLSWLVLPILPVTARTPPFTKLRVALSLPSSLPLNLYSLILNSDWARIAITAPSVMRNWALLATPVLIESPDCTLSPLAKGKDLPARRTLTSPKDISTLPASALWVWAWLSNGLFAKPIIIMLKMTRQRILVAFMPRMWAPIWFSICCNISLNSNRSAT